MCPGGRIPVSFRISYGYPAYHGLRADVFARKSTRTKYHRVCVTAQSLRKFDHDSTKILARHPLARDGVKPAKSNAKYTVRDIAFSNPVAKCDVIGSSEETHLQVRMMTYRVALVAAVMSGGTFFAGASLAQELPPGGGRDTVQGACTACHGVNIIVSQRRTPDEWRDVVSQMVGNGASLTDDQFATVVKYLSTALAPDGAAPTATH